LKFYVNETYDVETETLERRDETETMERRYQDETETFKKCLETISRPRLHWVWLDHLSN